MKIYTRRGDTGQTELIGGERVPKDDARVEAYGTIDELMAQVGVLITRDECAPRRETLGRIQHHLMTCASHAAVGDDPKGIAAKIPPITPSDVQWLEAQIDLEEAGLPPLRNFVLPGGTNTTVALSHVCRAVTRRAERRLLSNERIPQEVLQLINRLSDYFFTLGRRLAQETGDMQIPWVPK